MSVECRAWQDQDARNAANDAEVGSTTTEIAHSLRSDHPRYDFADLDFSPQDIIGLKVTAAGFRMDLTKAISID